jgi:hypothetical protein
MPTLEDAEVMIDKAAGSVWNPQIGGKAIVGMGAGAVIGLLAQQLKDVINAILISLAALAAFHLFTTFNPETFGAESVQETFGAANRKAAQLLDQNDDGRFDEKDVGMMLRRVMPSIRRQMPFILGFAFGLAVLSSTT